MNSLKLPDLGTDRPSYNITIPTTNEQVTYQSYTKNTEKTILIASQDKDYESLIPTLLNVLENHCSTQIKTVIDFMYVLAHIRSKSHGGEQTFVINKCKNKDCDNGQIEINIKEILNHIKIENKDIQKKTYKITDNISLRLAPTKIGMLENIKFDNTAENGMNQIYNMVAYSVEYVIRGDQIIKDFTVEELIDKIIKHLTPKQIEDINNELDNMIKIYIEFEYTCPKCKTKQIERVSDFLSLS